MSHEGTHPRTGGEQVTQDTQFTMGDVDFSRVNLQYLICARDLAREFPERATVLLGVPEVLVKLLAELSADQLAAVIEIKAPLLIPRQEPWWWDRLFTAIHAGHTDKLQAVLEQAGLIVANG